jgi:hypothetical protein
MIAIGTKVISNSQSGFRIGQIADHQTDRWGTHHVVLVDGQFEQIDNIGSADMLGIGWKIASESEIARAARYATR